MAGRRTSIISGVILVICSTVSVGEVSRAFFDDEPHDTVFADTVDIDDSTEPGVDDDGQRKFRRNRITADTAAEKLDSALYRPADGRPYYSSYLSAKSLGDYLSYRTGVLALQHGSIGQAEMLTGSVMLGGLPVVYNGLPVFHQGSYFPFRSGPDLTAMMTDNIYSMDVLPLSNLNVFSQGRELALQSMIWPPDNNPSSVTVAQGPYAYEKSAWRFSRRLGQSIAGSFTASFKESRGFYAQGADYDDFRVSGLFAWCPRVRTELQYSFYQHKAKQGLMQFDRMILPTTRSHNDLNHHWLKFRQMLSNASLFKLTIFRQLNYNRIFDETYQYNDIIRDNIIGGSASIDLTEGRHIFTLATGAKRYQLNGVPDKPVSTTLAVMLADSISLGESHHLVMKGRVRNNNQTELGIAGSAVYRLYGWSIAMGALDYEPDIYAMYYDHPQFSFDSQSLISSYKYIPDPDLKPMKILFASSAADFMRSDTFSGRFQISYEKVYNDLVPIIENTNSDWTSAQKNIDYDRLVFTADLDYRPIKYFSGKSGVTYFYYNPDTALAGVKHSPSVIAFSHGEIKIPGVLKDIDLAGVFQVRYYSKRYYAGLSSVLLDRFEYDQAIVVDGSLAMRFGSFEFRITEDNILDYLIDNNYEIWGEYTMPPGMVWWQFTWNFIN